MNELHKKLLDGCWRGALKEVEMLIKQGVDVNIKDEKGHTALHIAAISDHNRVVKSLIKGGADVNAKDIRGNTPLFYVIAWGWDESRYAKRKIKIAKLLINAGADVNYIDDSQYYGPRSLLSWAENPKIIKLLIKAGAKTTEFYTPCSPRLKEYRERKITAEDLLRNEGYDGGVYIYKAGAKE
jgi:ankyrin repeat protein